MKRRVFAVKGADLLIIEVNAKNKILNEIHIGNADLENVTTLLISLQALHENHFDNINNETLH